MSTQDLATHASNWITTASWAIRHWASTASASTYSAIFSGCSVIFSGGALWTAKAYRRQGDQARRAQASTVTLHRRATEQAGPPDGLLVHNYSDLPIFGVKIWLGRQEHLLEVQLETDDGTKVYNRYPVVPPHGHGKLEVEAGVNVDDAKLEFYDSAHRRWRRGLRGRLRELQFRRLLGWRR
jgi:hypothetical protein